MESLNDFYSRLESLIPQIHRAILSAPSKKDSSLPERIDYQKTSRKDEILFLAEKRIGKKAFHQNLSPEKLFSSIKEALEESGFRQTDLFCEDAQITFRISKKGKISQSVNRNGAPAATVTAHNREKNYLIREGDPVPFLVDLGVFTKEYKIVHAKYDKFRQINRFVEILDHAFKDYGKDEISVLDFGCGKSYLTFFVYYYFSKILEKKVTIIGYDLKEDVVSHCNELAKKYGYHGLKFVVADVTKDRLSQERIDFVLSLHACDVATDYALNFALENKVPYVFSVPCCQHEIGQSIRKGGGDLDLFLDYGIFQERMCALLTDSFRCKILSAEGYRVDVLEFVDFSHSPKNIMIRARKSSPSKKLPEELFDLEEKYGFRQTLLHLRKDAK